MAEPQPNGLASMTQARARRARRTMPPPRHPASANPSPADLAPLPPSEAGPAAGDTAVPMPTPKEDPRQRPPLDRPITAEKPAASARRPNAAPAAGEARGPARPATLYLEEAHVDFLEEARMAGLISRPRLDISKSAVVRLALMRLQRQMTVGEIREYLAAQPVDSTKTGRKKR